MTKEKKVKLQLSVYQAAAVRQILFESQKGYTYDEGLVPSRIASIRDSVRIIDDAISIVVESD
jgi:hypothetical protein